MKKNSLLFPVVGIFTALLFAGMVGLSSPTPVRAQTTLEGFIQQFNLVDFIRGLFGLTNPTTEGDPYPTPTSVAPTPTPTEGSNPCRPWCNSDSCSGGQVCGPANCALPGWGKCVDAATMCPTSPNYRCSLGSSTNWNIRNEYRCPNSLETCSQWNGTLFPEGYFCQAGHQCLSERCENERCVATVSNGCPVGVATQCTNVVYPNWDVVPDKTCPGLLTTDKCKTWNGTFQVNGAYCTSSGQCRSGLCANNQCIASGSPTMTPTATPTKIPPTPTIQPTCGTNGQNYRGSCVNTTSYTYQMCVGGQWSSNSASGSCYGNTACTGTSSQSGVADTNTLILDLCVSTTSDCPGGTNYECTNVVYPNWDVEANRTCNTAGLMDRCKKWNGTLQVNGAFCKASNQCRSSLCVNNQCVASGSPTMTPTATPVPPSGNCTQVGAKRCIGYSYDTCAPSSSNPSVLVWTAGGSCVAGCPSTFPRCANNNSMLQGACIQEDSNGCCTGWTQIDCPNNSCTGQSGSAQCSSVPTTAPCQYFNMTQCEVACGRACVSCTGGSYRCGTGPTFTPTPTTRPGTTVAPTATPTTRPGTTVAPTATTAPGQPAPTATTAPGQPNPTATPVPPTAQPGAPSCNPANVTMAVAPTTAGICGQLQFSLSGNEGQTQMTDVFSGGMVNGILCPTNKPWPGFTCTARKPGTYTWTHTWKVCSGTNCSNTCSATKTFTVTAPQFSQWVSSLYVPYLFSGSTVPTGVDMNCDGKGNWTDYEILRKGFTL